MKPSKILDIFLVFCLIQFWGCGPRIANVNSKGEGIICFGDSITKGTGATEGNDYPSLLSQRLDAPVINAGVDGNTTRDALQRIEKEVLTHNPRMVIVEFSGNDFLQRIPLQETLENLDKMVAMIQERGAMAVLLEVRAGYFGDEYIDGFKQIAQKRWALLIPNILKGILANPSLKSDQIHPNDAGYRLIADRVYKKIEPLLH
jgi:acyl-CoA hydrolase